MQDTKSMTPADKVLKELDKAIASLDKPNFDIVKIAETIQRACKFLVALVEQTNRERVELEEDLSDMTETVDSLIEQNEILQVDIQVILEFLKKSGIDLSYVVTRSDIAKKVKGNSPE